MSSQSKICSFCIYLVSVLCSPGVLCFLMQSLLAMLGGDCMNLLGRHFTPTSCIFRQVIALIKLLWASGHVVSWGTVPQAGRSWSSFSMSLDSSDDCATSRKVLVPLPDVTGFFSWPNLHIDTMALYWTQPQAENFESKWWLPARKADNLSAICEPIVWKLLDPRRPHSPMGLQNMFLFVALNYWHNLIWQNIFLINIAIENRIEENYTPHFDLKRGEPCSISYLTFHFVCHP
jgi:hypothetical protein